MIKKGCSFGQPFFYVFFGNKENKFFIALFAEKPNYLFFFNPQTSALNIH
jgi:hypothetical protein